MQAIEQQQNVRIVYNPYILYLLYVKMRYLFYIINRLYKNRVETNKDLFTYILDCCVLNNHYADLLVEDLILMRDRMQHEAYPIELTQSHFEFYLFRATQTFRTPLELVDRLFTSSYFVCESRLLVAIKRDIHTMALQKLLRLYTESYYLNHTSEKSIQRMTLFFSMKTIMEKRVSDVQLDKEDTQFYIRYDVELSAVLFYLYLISELYCINEIDATVLNPSLLVEYYTVKQRKLFDEAISIDINNSTISNEKGEFTMTHLVLQRAFAILCETYQSLVIDRLTYYSKEDLFKSTEPVSFFTSLFTPLTTTTTEHGIAHKESHDNYRRIINREYILTAPVTETYSPSSMTTGESVKRLGRSDFYNANEKLLPGTLKAVPINYLPLKANPRLYILCLYRLAFDLKLTEAHTDCRNTMGYSKNSSTRNECYLCAYCNRDRQNNVKIRDFIEHCKAYDPENPHKIEQYVRLCEGLDKMYIDLMPSLTLLYYKTFTSVCWLFEFIPFTLAKDVNCATHHNLFRMINPIALMEDLSRQVTRTKLDKAMSDLVSIVYKKLRLEPEQGIMVEREQSIAMACEIVRLFAQSVNMQCNEIQRYERSQSTELLVDTTQFCREVAAALKKIYIGHLDILFQVIMERHDGINFDI